jgi:hypothetical protein
MAANSAQIKNLLLPGLYKVAGQYDRYPKEWSQVFTTVKSTLQTESAVQTRILGLAQMKVEGGATAFDNNMGQRYVWNATAFEVALGYAITLRAIEDNQYTKDFNMMNLKLIDSFSQFKEIQGANILNNGQTYDPTVGGDGVALFSTAHPYDLGTWANTFAVPLDLNESSLLQSYVNIGSTFVDEAGLRVNAKGTKLIVPPDACRNAPRHGQQRPERDPDDASGHGPVDGLPLPHVKLRVVREDRQGRPALL